DFHVTGVQTCALPISTECSPILTLNQKGERRGVGYPLPGVELKIVDPLTKVPLKQGEAGLILARGENIFKGYLQEGEEVFEKGRSEERRVGKECRTQV